MRAQQERWWWWWWWCVTAILGGGWVGVAEGVAGVEELTRLHTLDGVITGLLRAHLHHHLPEDHLPEHPTQSTQSLAAHLSHVKRYIQEYPGDCTSILKEAEEEEEQKTWEKAWEEGGVAGDPLRSLVVARRLAKDWPSLRDAAPPTLNDWHDIVVAVEAVEEALRVEAGKDIYLEALEESLAYLHHLYHLDALHLARGHLTHTRYYRQPAPLRVEDLVGVAVAALEEEMYGTAVEWLTAAQHMNNEDTSLSVNSRALNKQKQHLSLLLQVAMAAHDDKLAAEGFKGQRGIYPQPLSKVPLKDQKAAEEGKKPTLPRQLPAEVTSMPSDHRALGYLCRGHSLTSARLEGRLRCRVSSRGSAWLILMPLLEEDVSLDPPVVSFHRLLSDAQLTTLKHLGAPLLMPASVQGAEGKQVARYRASHTAWLGGGTHHMVRSVNRLAAALTGLAVDEAAGEAEVLQVNQYSAGGHYVPHMDFMALYRNTWEAGHLNHSLLQEHPQGDRIATLMFYMNDVPEGGRTVFPRLGVGVAPQKGSAIFWWNLLPSGKGDERTLHAACPVLRGTKWVSNVWIKYYPQVHHRPCVAPPVKQ